MNATLTKTENLSGIVTALESAHAMIQEKTGAPRATILVTRKTGRTMGHFTHAKLWKAGEESFHEIMISANYFTRGARAVLGTLLHEVAHSLDLANGIQGVTGDGYHNKRFKATAEALGLTITQAKGIGWSVTDVSDECAERWAQELRLIEDALGVRADAEEGKKAPANCQINPRRECFAKTYAPCLLTSFGVRLLPGPALGRKLQLV